jgi:hypothetical protein
MAKKRSRKTEILPEQFDSLVQIVRGQRVMLDLDLARLYGVTTKSLNQAVQRNAERFPGDFAYQLTKQEFACLRPQIVTSRPGNDGQRRLPWAFTEHGVALLARVLRSPTVASVNVEVLRAFERLHSLLATPGELVEQVTRLAHTVQRQDEQIQTIVQFLDAINVRPKGARKAASRLRVPSVRSCKIRKNCSL